MRRVAAGDFPDVQGDGLRATRRTQGTPLRVNTNGFCEAWAFHASGERLEKRFMQYTTTNVLETYHQDKESSIMSSRESLDTHPC